MIKQEPHISDSKLDYIQVNKKHTKIPRQTNENKEGEKQKKEEDEVDMKKRTITEEKNRKKDMIII